MFKSGLVKINTVSRKTRSYGPVGLDPDTKMVREERRWNGWNLKFLLSGNLEAWLV